MESDRVKIEPLPIDDAHAAALKQLMDNIPVMSELLLDRWMYGEARWEVVDGVIKRLPPRGADNTKE